MKLNSSHVQPGMPRSSNNFSTVRKGFGCFSMVLVLAAFALPAMSQTLSPLLNEGFESGTIPATWSFSGPLDLDGTATSSSGINPTAGTYYGWISTGCDTAAGTTCPDVASLSPGGYSSLGLGLGSGLGLPTVETTLTSPSFTLNSPGGVVSFDVNFITTDGTNSFADFALVQLVPSNEASPVNLFVANTTGATSPAVPPAVLTPGVGTMSPTTASFTGTTVTLTETALESNSPTTTFGNVQKFGGGLGGPSAWIHVTYTAPAGTYFLQFLVSHVGDMSYPSALAIDNVLVQQTVIEPLNPTTTTFTFINTTGNTNQQTLDYTNSGFNPASVSTTGQITLMSISDAQFQNLTMGTFAQGSQCMKQDLGNGIISCAGTIVLCTNANNPIPAGANCTPPQGTPGLIGVTHKYLDHDFSDPTQVPNPGYLAATDNALSCPPPDTGNTCRQAYNIFTGIAQDCCTTSGGTQHFNSLFVPLSNLQTWYQPPGTTCDGDVGHVVLQPINADGTSVWKAGRTIPVKFRVCDGTGTSVGTLGVVTNFQLTQIVSGTLVQNVDETIDATTADSGFKWDATDQQWVFNLSTKGQAAGQTYRYAISLNDGTVINFQYGLR